MDSAVASSLGLLVELRGAAIALVLTAFVSLFARSVALLLTDPRRGALVASFRGLSATAWLALSWLYGLFTSHIQVWDARAAGVALATAVAVLSPLALRRFRKRPTGVPGPTAALSQLSLLLGLLLVATVTLMAAGFLALTEDRPVLLVDVTGEVSTQSVKWAPPNEAPREEGLATHRVVFRTPEGIAVAEAWIYGDQVAVKGRVLRLSPFLNTAGLSNLFELQFAHNGYFTAARHNLNPHAAVPLPRMGPLAVHPWWRKPQARLLESWERGTAEGSRWAVRAATTESTYFPLVDSEGKPVRKTFRVVLTPGGLSSS